MKYFIAGIIIILILGAVFYLYGSKPSESSSQTTQGDMQKVEPQAKNPEQAQAPANTMENETGKMIQEVTIGTGAEAKNGNTVFVHYTGIFTDGKKFDSSRDRGQPLSFVLGSGQVIKGWDMGILGMKVGGKRKLVIPSDLAYGPNGIPGAIPPNATLLFDVELIDVK